MLLHCGESPSAVLVHAESSVITADDFMGMCAEEEQMSSSNAAESHSLFKEPGVLVPSVQYNLKAEVEEGVSLTFWRRQCILQTQVLVHNQPLLPFQQEFLIQEVLVDEWSGYNPDIHCVGALLFGKLWTVMR